MGKCRQQDCGTRQLIWRRRRRRRRGGFSNWLQCRLWTARRRVWSRGLVSAIGAIALPGTTGEAGWRDILRCGVGMNQVRVVRLVVARLKRRIRQGTAYCSWCTVLCARCPNELCSCPRIWHSRAKRWHSHLRDRRWHPTEGSHPPPLGGHQRSSKSRLVEGAWG